MKRISKRDVIIADCCADWPELTKHASWLSDEYGFWLSPENKLHPVDMESHGVFIINHPEIFGRWIPGQNKRIDDLAFDKGWIRIVTGYQDELNFQVPSQDNKYLHQIQSVLSKLPNKATVFVSINHDGFIKVPYWDFTESHTFQQLIHQTEKTANLKLSKRAKNKNGDV